MTAIIPTCPDCGTILNDGEVRCFNRPHAQCTDAQHEQSAQARIAEARAAAFRDIKNRIAYRRDKWDKDGFGNYVRAAEALLEDIAAIEEAAKR